MSALSGAWQVVVSLPWFGVLLSFVVYALVMRAAKAMGNPPWANPVLCSVLVVVAVLHGSGVSYERYFATAQSIHWLLGPAVVAMAWPLWQRRAVLRARGVRLVLVALVGGAAAAGSAIGLAWALGLPEQMVLSVASKSVTTAVAMAVSDQIGGIAALSAAFSLITGMIGAVLGKGLFLAMRLPHSPKGWMARGFALGTAAHGIGSARAMQVNADAGAYAVLAMGLQALLVALLAPLAAHFWLG